MKTEKNSYAVCNDLRIADYLPNGVFAVIRTIETNERDILVGWNGYVPVFAKREFLTADIEVRYTMDDDFLVYGDNKLSLAMWYTKSAIKSFIRHAGTGNGKSPVNNYFSTILTRYIGQINSGIINNTTIEMDADLQDMISNVYISLAENDLLGGGVNTRKCAYNAMYRYLYNDGRLTNKHSIDHDMLYLDDIDPDGGILTVDMDGKINGKSEITDEVKTLVNGALDSISSSRDGAVYTDYVGCVINGRSPNEYAKDVCRSYGAVRKNICIAQKKVNSFAETHKMEIIKAFMGVNNVEPDENDIENGTTAVIRDDISTPQLMSFGL